MTDPSDFKIFLSLFDAYAASFRNGDPQLEDAVRLKHGHTRRVITEMDALCDSINLDVRNCLLARIAALFHDIARFEQFRKYRTFSDIKSENHGEMGVAIIARQGLLADLAPMEQDAVIAAIQYHNAIEIPAHLSSEQSFLCRLLRDADKLDIYQVAIDYYLNPDPKRHETVQVGIPDGSAVNPEVCDSILSRKTVPYEKIKTIADFRMLQLGWIFDLNFKHSFRCVKERGYIANIKRLLPASPDVEKAIAAVEQYLEEQASQSALM